MATICILCNEEIVPLDPLGEGEKRKGVDLHYPWHSFLYAKHQVESGDKKWAKDYNDLLAVVEIPENLPEKVRIHRLKIRDTKKR